MTSDREIQLSVVLPNFNHGSFLARALTAILQQEPAPDEVIVVDDGSTDDSVSIAHEFAARSSAVRVLVNATNEGVVPAMQRGLDASRGRYVYFAASDDWVLAGFFALAVRTLRDHPEAGLFCGEAIVIDGVTGEHKGLRPAVRPASRSCYVGPTSTRKLLGRIDNWMLTGSSLFRRDAIVGAGGLQVELGAFADGFLARKIALTHGFCFAPSIVYVWRVFLDGISRTTALDPESAARILQTVPNWIERDPAFPEWYPHLFGRRWRFAVSHLALYNMPVNRSLLLSLGATSSFDAAIISAVLAAFPQRLARPLILSWLWMRLRPTSLLGLMSTKIQRWTERARKVHSP